LNRSRLTTVSSAVISVLGYPSINSEVVPAAVELR
jgi:hypothetical protein